MYLTRAEGMLALGGLAGYEAFLDDYFQFLRGQAGLVAAAALNSRGFPAKYTILTRWQSRDTAVATMRSETLTRLVAAHALTTLITASRPVEAYDLVCRVVGSGPLDAVYLIDEVVRQGPGNLPAFEESRGEVYRLRQQFGQGFALSMLSRFLGGGNRYLIFGAFNNDGDDAATGNRPEIQQYWQQHPEEQKMVIQADREFYEITKTATEELV